MQQYFSGALAGLVERKRAREFAGEGLRYRLVDGREGAAGGGRIGRIGLNDNLGPFAADQFSREVAGDGDDELDGAALQKLVGLLFRRHGVRKTEITCIADGADQGPGECGVVGGENRRGQALGVVVDGKAEEHELHDGNAEHHGEGQAVAAKLERLLVDHGKQPVEKAHR